MPATTGERPTSAGLDSEQVWRAIASVSFLVLACVTPSGEPRSVDVMYQVARARVPVTLDESER